MWRRISVTRKKSLSCFFGGLAVWIFIGDILGADRYMGWFIIAVVVATFVCGYIEGSEMYYADTEARMRDERDRKELDQIADRVERAGQRRKKEREKMTKKEQP